MKTHQFTRLRLLLIDTSSSIQAIRLWNSLTIAIKSSINKDAFRKTVREQYFLSHETNLKYVLQTLSQFSYPRLV